MTEVITIRAVLSPDVVSQGNYLISKEALLEMEKKFKENPYHIPIRIGELEIGKVVDLNIRHGICFLDLEIIFDYMKVK